MSYVLRRTKDGLYAYGRGNWNVGFTEDLQEARVYGRKTDAKNSLNGFANYNRQSTADFAVLPVKLALLPTKCSFSGCDGAGSSEFCLTQDEADECMTRRTSYQRRGS